MTAALQRWLEARWWRQAPVPAWLAALSRLYAWQAARRARRAAARATALPVPVLVVGNLTVGGSGKTPVVIALAEALRARGWRPGVVSRGYGGAARGCRVVPADGDPALFGDEPVLIARRTGVPVVVGRDRVAAARRLLDGGGVDLVLADDGLQHHRLARDVEVCVVDGRRRFGNGRLLPAGPLREPLARLAGVDLVLANGPAQEGEEAFTLAPADPWRLADGQRRPLAGFAGRPVHAVAGIGDPARFFDTLRGQGLTVIEHPFPDHHRYRRGELAFDDGLPVLMTEKDAVKCLAFAAPDWYALPVAACLPDGVVDALHARLRSQRRG